MKIVLALIFFVAFVATVPFKRQAIDYVDKWEEVMEILKGYGIDGETMKEKMEEFWADPAHDGEVKVIVSKLLPSEANVDELVTELEQIDESELNDEEKSEKITKLIEEAGGDAEAVLNGIYTYLSDPARIKSFLGELNLEELLPADANLGEIEEKLKAVYEKSA